MGILDKLFEKKTCDICGGEIGLMGNRKLADGNLCKECASRLSPLFDERRHSTVEQIRAQLAYRAENEARVAAFNPTRTFGARTKLLMDDDMRALIVTTSSRWRDINPDVVDFSQVTGCAAEVRETKTEIWDEGPDGKRVHFDPPRYDVDYDIWVVVNVNSPYFDEIAFKVNDARLERRDSDAYRAAAHEADAIRDALAQAWEEDHAGADDGGAFGRRLADIERERRRDAADAMAAHLAAGGPRPGMRPPAPGANPGPRAGMPDGGPRVRPADPGASPHANPQARPADPHPRPGQHPAPMSRGVDTWFCPACGARCTERFCPACGHAKP